MLQIFAWLPWFKVTVLDPLEKNGFVFDTAQHVLKVNSPIMLLHAEDDSIVPYNLGKKVTPFLNFVLGLVCFYIAF